MDQFIFLLQEGATGAGQEVQTGPFGIPYFAYMMVGLLAVFYFFMIRPQQQQQKKEKQFREALSKGDKIMTIGGIHGVVDKIADNTITVKVDDNTKIVMEKSSIRAMPSEEPAKK
ncbi:MAG: preprotein translocase subunit YajC [Bacteroidia bacterium]|nr:preprotein translocase subunit YajC [Bacteroidia bacterium]